MNDYNDLLQTAIDGVLSEEDALQFIIENGADEELLKKLGYSNAIEGSKLIKANIIDYVLRKCGRNKALLMGVFALLISSGQLFGYEVKKGDTLWGIAQRSDCDLEQIYSLNPELKNIKYIKPGMNIVLPNEVKNSAPAETNNDGYYIVKSGDTFSGIAAMYGISIQQLKKLNPDIKNPDFIKPGMKIVLPEIKEKSEISNQSPNGQLNLDAVLKALREIESTNGANTLGDGGKAVGDYQLWEIFVEDYHRLGGKKEYQCHVIDGVAQPDDVRWDRKKCEEMIKYVFKKYGYESMQQVLKGFGSGKGRRPGWNKGVSDSKLQEYIDAYNKYNK